MVSRLAVVLRDDLLREPRDAANRLIREVERCLLLALKAPVESRPCVTRIGGDDGETAGKRRRRARGLGAEREGDVAIQPSASLLEKAPVPVVWQIDREADAV